MTPFSLIKALLLGSQSIDRCHIDIGCCKMIKFSFHSVRVLPGQPRVPNQR